MQGLATSTDRVSLSFFAPRNQSKTHTKPTRVCFFNVGPFPKSKILRQIVPLLANDFASSSSFAYDRRLPRRVTASADDNSSITTVAENRLQNRLFMVYCCLGFMWMVKKEFLPHYFRFHMIMGLLLEACEFFPWININGRLRVYYTILVMGFSCTLTLVDILWWAAPKIALCFVGAGMAFVQLCKVLGLS
ncbi:unnamed protein product [Arabidopsis halleri]